MNKNSEQKRREQLIEKLQDQLDIVSLGEQLDFLTLRKHIEEIENDLNGRINMLETMKEKLSEVEKWLDDAEEVFEPVYEEDDQRKTIQLHEQRGALAELSLELDFEALKEQLGEIDYERETAEMPMLEGMDEAGNWLTKAKEVLEMTAIAA